MSAVSFKFHSAARSRVSRGLDLDFEFDAGFLSRVIEKEVK
jgi:hypothetical protein